MRWQHNCAGRVVELHRIAMSANSIPAVLRRGPFFGLSAGVLLLHLWLLWVLSVPLPVQVSPQPSSVVRPAAIEVLPRQAALPESKAAAQTAIEVKTTRRPSASVAAKVVASTAPEPPAVAAVPTPAMVPDGAEVPVYATVIPAPTSLQFVLQRGPLTGAAEMHWSHRGGDYELLLEGVVGGVPVLASTSRGSIDADGVAPQRHAERKRAREVRAVNFQRDAGLISFSGPDLQLPLRPGAQDRLSWLIQLPAIFEADPALSTAGAEVTLFVVGSRGDAQAWRFQVLGHEPLDLPAGQAAKTVRLLREPSRPFDTRAEVWLDPARGHLPVRAVFTTVPGGQPLELQLSRVVGAAP
jgi:hypothetical protein